MKKSGLNLEAIDQLKHDWDWHQELPGPSFGSRERRVNPILRAESRDELTDLYNRKYVEQHLEALDKAGVPYAIVVADLNNFGAINKIIGYSHGNTALETAAKMLGEVVLDYEEDPELKMVIGTGRAKSKEQREAEERRKHITGRYGGDEFVVVVNLGNVETSEGQRNMLDAIIDDIHSLDSEHISFAAGYSISDGRQHRAVFDEADRAMQLNKLHIKGGAVS